MALARALAKQPKLLLLDEPLAALDKKLREHTQFEIMSIQERTGITFVVVTHDQEEAMTLADRIAVMDKGVIRQVGPPAEVYEHPEQPLRRGLHRLDQHVRGQGERNDGAPSPCRHWEAMSTPGAGAAAGREGDARRAAREDRDQRESSPRLATLFRAW